jgi:hypothetical protein
MKHIISFFARKPSEPAEELGLSFVRLQSHEGTLTGPIPLAINYLARTRLTVRDFKKTGTDNHSKG